MLLEHDILLMLKSDGYDVRPMAGLKYKISESGSIDTDTGERDYEFVGILEFEGGWSVKGEVEYNNIDEHVYVDHIMKDMSIVECLKMTLELLNNAIFNTVRSFDESE